MKDRYVQVYRETFSQEEIDGLIAFYQTPVGQYFVTSDDLPTDWYLRLTGAATRMIRGETPLSLNIPNPVPLPSK